MTVRSTGTITLRPIGNSQVTLRFMSLNTGCKLKKRRWTPLPMSIDVIDRVHAMARRDPHSLQFLNQNHQPISADTVNKDGKT